MRIGDSDQAKPVSSLLRVVKLPVGNQVFVVDVLEAAHGHHELLLSARGFPNPHLPFQRPCPCSPLFRTSAEECTSFDLLLPSIFAASALRKGTGAGTRRYFPIEEQLGKVRRDYFPN